MAGILIFGEATDSGISRATLQIATAAADLAEALGEPLSGALIGSQLGRAADEFHCGLASLYLVEGVHYRPYTAEAYVVAAQAVIATAAPSVALFVQGPDTRDWVPQLAARIGTGLVTDCTGFATERGSLIVSKPVNGGGVLAEFIVHGTPRMATVRPGDFQPRVGPASAERIHLAVAPPPERVTVLAETALQASGGPRLKDAKIVIGGGRGVGGTNNWHLIEDTAAVLGAAIGCSRPIADSGCVPSTHQVGLSGTSIAPDLYVAVGISGAAQHLAGITAAKTVIAINTDASADIFMRADYGVVDDCREVLPAFIERVKQLRT